MTTDAQPPATGATAQSDAHSDSPTRLHSRGLVFLRIAWMLLILLDFLLLSLAIPATYHASVQQGLTTDRMGLAQLNLSAETFAALRTGTTVVSTVISLGIGLFLFASRSDDWMVLLVSSVFITVTPGTTMVLRVLGATQPAWLAPVVLHFSVGVIATALMAFTFPTGHFVPTWTRLALLLFVGFVLVNAGMHLAQQTGFDPTAALAVSYSLGVIAQINRYRHMTSAIQRQQLRWIFFGYCIFVPIFVLFSLLSAFVIPSQGEPQRILFGLWGVLLLLYLPVLLHFTTTLFAILRYHLWDIDVLIHRTLVYVPLTALLAGIFAASITLTQKVFIAVTGQSSDAATVLTTLIVVAAFDPLKNGLHQLVEQRFKAARDPIQGINQYGAGVQAVVQVLDAEQLIRGFLEHALREFSATGGAVHLQRAGTAPFVWQSETWDSEVRLRVPLQHDGVEIGHLDLGARKNGQGYTEAERAALQMNAERIAHALTVIHHL